MEWSRLLHLWSSWEAIGGVLRKNFSEILQCVKQENNLKQIVINLFGSIGK